MWVFLWNMVYKFKFFKYLSIKVENTSQKSKQIVDSILDDLRKTNSSDLLAYASTIISKYQDEFELNKSYLRNKIIETFNFHERPTYLKVEPIISFLDNSELESLTQRDFQDVKQLVREMISESTFTLKESLTYENRSKALIELILGLKLIYCSESELIKSLSIESILENKYFILKQFKSGRTCALAYIQGYPKYQHEVPPNPIQEKQLFFLYNFLVNGYESSYSNERGTEEACISIKQKDLIDEFLNWSDLRYFEKKFQGNSTQEQVQKDWCSVKRSISKWLGFENLLEDSSSGEHRVYHFLMAKKYCLNKIPNLRYLQNTIQD